MSLMLNVYLDGVLAVLICFGGVVGYCLRDWKDRPDNSGLDKEGLEEFRENIFKEVTLWAVAWPALLAAGIVYSLLDLYRTRNGHQTVGETYRYSVSFNGEPPPPQPVTLTTLETEGDVKVAVYRTPRKGFE